MDVARQPVLMILGLDWMDIVWCGSLIVFGNVFVRAGITCGVFMVLFEKTLGSRGRVRKTTFMLMDEGTSNADLYASFFDYWIA